MIITIKKRRKQGTVRAAGTRGVAKQEGSARETRILDESPIFTYAFTLTHRWWFNNTDAWDVLFEESENHRNLKILFYKFYRSKFLILDAFNHWF